MDALYASMSVHPMFQSVVSWLTATMISAVPPATFAAGQASAKAVETEEETTARYASLAESIATVAYDPSETPLFSGDHGRAQTALLLIAVAKYESTLRKDVGTGRTRGDHGRSCTYFQFNLGGGKTPNGHTCEELLADQTLAAREALYYVRDAFENCAYLPPDDRLSRYTSGKCQRNDFKSRVRWLSAAGWMKKNPAPYADDDLMIGFMD